MDGERQVNPVEKATRDVYRHSLGSLKSEFAKLVYLSSLRPLGGEAYQHEGLSMRYGAEEARQALLRCHWEVFWGLIVKPLEWQHRDLENYLQELDEDLQLVLQRWQDQQSYRLLVPDSATPLLRQAFHLNCEILLSLIQKKGLLNSSISVP